MARLNKLQRKAKRARKFCENTHLRITGRDSEIDPATGQPTYTIEVKTPFGWARQQEHHRAMIDRVASAPHNWIVAIVAELEGARGEPYEDSVEWPCEKIRLEEMNEFFREKKAELLDPLNKHHLKDVYFVARSVNDRELAKYRAEADELDTVRAIA